MNKQKKWYITVGAERIEVTEEVYHAYWHYTEKEKYFMGKLKQGGFVSSQEEETAKFISSREDSLERLSEHGIQFEDTSTPSPADVVTKDGLFFLLNQALSKLSEEEMHLIRELFYYEKTEREVCEALHYAKTSLHKKKVQILKKLKKEMEKK